MGWWSQDIYGGDEPLDWQEKIYEICETQVYGDNHKTRAIDKEVLSEKIETIISFIEKTEESNSKNIGYQILGAIIMHSGFDIDEVNDLRKKIIEASEDDEYAREDLARKNVMKNFKNLIKNYNFNEPVDISKINVFEQSDEVEDDISKEFKEIFGMMKSRIKKLERGIEEKSGVKEYDEGYAAASQEEIDFLTDFMELMSKMEMMGVLFEKIAQGLVGNSNPAGSERGLTRGEVIIPTSNSGGTGKDIMPG